MSQTLAAKIDLNGDHAIECGTSYERTITLCNFPDLTLYRGFCEFRKAGTKVLEAQINVISKDTFKILIPWTLTNTTEFRSSVATGEILYDVLFVEALDRFYAIRGKASFINTTTEIFDVPFQPVKTGKV